MFWTLVNILAFSHLKVDGNKPGKKKWSSSNNLQHTPNWRLSNDDNYCFNNFIYQVSLHATKKVAKAARKSWIPVKSQTKLYPTVKLQSQCWFYRREERRERRGGVYTEEQEEGEGSNIWNQSVCKREGAGWMAEGETEQKWKEGKKEQNEMKK